MSEPIGYSLFGPAVDCIALAICFYNLTFVNWRGLRKPAPMLVLLTIVFSATACLSQLIQHTPWCEGYNPKAPLHENMVCSKVLDLVFSIFDAGCSFTISYAYVLRLQCMIPTWEKSLRIFYILPTLYPFTNLPRILTKSILISSDNLGEDKFATIETSKKIFFIASISLAINSTAMHVVLIHQLLSPASPISRRLDRFKNEKCLLIAIMVINFGCIIGSSFYLFQQRFAAVSLVYLFYCVDFLIFCRVNRLISKAIMVEPIVIVSGTDSRLITSPNFDWGVKKDARNKETLDIAPSVVSERVSEGISPIHFSCSVPEDQYFGADADASSADNMVIDGTSDRMNVIPRVDSFGFLLDSVDHRIDFIDTDPRLYSQTSVENPSTISASSECVYDFDLDMPESFEGECEGDRRM